jgi:hypothetical protein
MPGTGSSFGGGTETTAGFGAWDQGTNSVPYPMFLDLDCRPNAGMKDPPYTRALAADARERIYAGLGPPALDLNVTRYDLGERPGPSSTVDPDEEGGPAQDWGHEEKREDDKPVPAPAPAPAPVQVPPKKRN